MYASDGHMLTAQNDYLNYSYLWRHIWIWFDNVHDGRCGMLQHIRHGMLRRKQHNILRGTGAGVNAA